MRLGGLQKTSLIDYPGKISCVIFLSGCNFDCPFCHNPELANGVTASPDELDKNQLYAFLEKRRGLLDGVVISGGEPTLQEDLFLLCEDIKQMGYPVKLDTNGSRPLVIRELIDKRLIDYIAMDVKTDPLKYCRLIQKNCNFEKILSSIQIILASGLPHEFRTTCAPALIDEEDIRTICRLIQGARLYALQKFHPDTVLHPDFFQNNNVCINDGQLQDFKSIATPWVNQCIIR
ncbi:MAG: anaerobic ribonucleoside-triphosphate reductase activating protein [Desulfobacterales bacterium]|nr:anaerobic ribonucleoside-triphosphate reductase activating protein [Desulfobacterales bacterium]MDD4071135.1 anaerobic ribonucleoside-triphosphate reductase activating protein [Desulfobacterales bacterium]MDD4391936.1 anaerobic ribonucleoside-triphosphate reductase activating protein [Desulfobacterales bacterium]